MKTAYQTGPGLYAVQTNKVDKSIPVNVARVYCCRLEAYDLPAESGVHDNIEFEIIFAKAQKDPCLARALLLLGETITANTAMLKEIAGTDS